VGSGAFVFTTCCKSCTFDRDRQENSQLGPISREGKITELSGKSENVLTPDRFRICPICRFIIFFLFLDKVELECQPAVAVIPLGTGNDLARCLRWGGGYEGESIHKMLHKIARAAPVMLDRWLIELSDTSLPDPDQKITDTRIPYNIINNYFSVGVVSASFGGWVFGSDNVASVSGVGRCHLCQISSGEGKKSGEIQQSHEK
jgi:hypothetical protein